MTDEELFQKAYNEADAKNIQQWDVSAFVQYCENLYKMTTKEFHLFFEKNDFEGNVNMQLWYRYTKENK